MRNGHDPASTPLQLQVNPQQAAQFALMFLARADMKPAERDTYAVAEGLLNAILSGQVVLAPPNAVVTPAVASAEPPAPEA